MQALLSVSRAPTLGSARGEGACADFGGCGAGVSAFRIGRRRKRLGLHAQRSTGYGDERRMGSQGQVRAKASDSNAVSSDVESPYTAMHAVNLGLAFFSKGRIGDALAQFDAALGLNPSEEEAQAALYNKACCHARREEGVQASQALKLALKQYNLKFSVILNDPDMAIFRSMPEFKDLQDEARKGGEEVGGSFRRDLKLISEVQAPFRGVRKFFYVAFSAAAGISTLFTIPRFIQAIQGGEGAPGLVGTLQNLAINIGGGGVFVALYIWETRKEEEQISRITRDETLSRLPLRLSTNRIVELVQLRETTRPVGFLSHFDAFDCVMEFVKVLLSGHGHTRSWVHGQKVTKSKCHFLRHTELRHIQVIIAGSAETVERSIKSAERYREDLLQRGVLLVPLVWSAKKVDSPRKKGFGRQQKLVGDDFEQRAQAVATKGVTQAEIRFKAEPFSAKEWENWVKEQQESEGVTPGEDVYIVLRLDGRVRKSGRGMPEWIDIVNELAPVDTFISKLEK